jgi:hypothetical protein
MNGWLDMAIFPQDGSVCDILFDCGDNAPVIATKIHWGYPPIGSQMTFVGEVNILSPWLVSNYKMLGWRPHQKEGVR